MSYGICNLPIIPLRKEPSHRSEMVSQLLFGESFEVMDIKTDWLFVRLAHDGYEGWIDGKQQVAISETVFNSLQHDTQWIADLSAYAPCTKVNVDEWMHLLPGSTLPNLNEDSFRIGNFDYLYLGLSTMPQHSSFSVNVETAARFYLNTPYLWGGRSLFGIDCSGFVQIIYKHFDMRVPRDAYQQAREGRVVECLQSAQAGDLAFFNNEEGKIDHVGILLNESEIIHASGRVKVDQIDEQGIFSGELNRYTHRLRIVKRLVQ